MIGCYSDGRYKAKKAASQNFFTTLLSTRNSCQHGTVPPGLRHFEKGGGGNGGRIRRERQEGTKQSARSLGRCCKAIGRGLSGPAVWRRGGERRPAALRRVQKREKLSVKCPVASAFCGFWLPNGRLQRLCLDKSVDGCFQL